MTRRSHRSFVSYIDRSREYYAAQGYEQPYRWVAHDSVSFTPLQKSLADSRIGVVTTSFFERGAEPAGVPPMPPKPPYAAAVDAVSGPMYTADLFWASDETHTDDLGSYLPLDHLRALEAAGEIGSLGPRFYGVPTAYSSRRTQVRDAPQILEWMREDDVDLALLIPL